MQSDTPDDPPKPRRGRPPAPPGSRRSASAGVKITLSPDEREQLRDALGHPSDGQLSPAARELLFDGMAVREGRDWIAQKIENGLRMAMALGKLRAYIEADPSESNKTLLCALIDEMQYVAREGLDPARPRSHHEADRAATLELIEELEKAGAEAIKQLEGLRPGTRPEGMTDDQRTALCMFLDLRDLLDAHADKTPGTS